MMCCASFHFCTLEEYYTGGLFLGPMNGVTDGSVGIIILFLIMGFTGNNIWRQEFKFGKDDEYNIRAVDIVILLLILT